MKPQQGTSPVTKANRFYLLPEGTSGKFIEFPIKFSGGIYWHLCRNSSILKMKAYGIQRGITLAQGIFRKVFLVKVHWSKKPTHFGN